MAAVTIKDVKTASEASSRAAVVASAAYQALAATKAAAARAAARAMMRARTNGANEPGEQGRDTESQVSAENASSAEAVVSSLSTSGKAEGLATRVETVPSGTQGADAVAITTTAAVTVEDPAPSLAAASQQGALGHAEVDASALGLQTTAQSPPPKPAASGRWASSAAGGVTRPTTSDGRPAAIRTAPLSIDEDFDGQGASPRELLAHRRQEEEEESRARQPPKRPVGELTVAELAAMGSADGEDADRPGTTIGSATAAALSRGRTRRLQDLKSSDIKDDLGRIWDPDALRIELHNTHNRLLEQDYLSHLEGGSPEGGPPLQLAKVDPEDLRRELEAMQQPQQGPSEGPQFGPITSLPSLPEIQMETILQEVSKNLRLRELRVANMWEAAMAKSNRPWLQLLVVLTSVAIVILSVVAYRLNLEIKLVR